MECLPKADHVNRSAPEDLSGHSLPTLYTWNSLLPPSYPTQGKNLSSPFSTKLSQAVSPPGPQVWVALTSWKGLGPLGSSWQGGPWRRGSWGSFLWIFSYSAYTAGELWTWVATTTCFNLALNIPVSNSALKSLTRSSARSGLLDLGISNETLMSLKLLCHPNFKSMAQGDPYWNRNIFLVTMRTFFFPFLFLP